MADLLRVLLVDDHPVVRGGLRAELEQDSQVTVVGEVDCIQQALALVQGGCPDVVVMGVQFPDGSGIDACRQILTTCPTSSVLILTAYDWDVYLAGAWSSGAAGFVAKDVGRAQLAEMVRRVGAGESLYTPEQRSRIALWHAEVQPRWESLTPREQEVLELMAAQYTDREMALRLGVVPKTVESHAQAIREKLGVRTRRQAVAWARERRLVDG